MPRFWRSMRTRIALVAGLLSLTGIALITLLVTHILYGDMQEMVFKQQLTATQFAARDIDGKLKLRLDSLKRVAENFPTALFADHAAMQAWLDDRKAINTLFPTSLLIIPADGGAPLADTPHVNNRPRSFVDRDWFIGAVSTGQPFISKPLITRATGEPALVIAVPIFDRKGSLLGVLAGISPLASPGFLDLIIGARPGRLGSYQLIAPQHRLFALTSDIETAVSPLPPAGRDGIIDQATSPFRGSALVRNSDGEEELISIADVPTSGWLLLARQPASEAFAPVANAVRNTLSIATLIALPIIIALLALLSRLLQPIAVLAREIRGMAEGTRAMLPLDTNAPREIADVALSFNRLQEKLLVQEQRLADMAHYDVLTGLPNRLLITDRLENEVKQLPRVTRGLAVLFLDLDGFKSINDQYGHQIGDLLLIEIATRLRACGREVDTVGRLGGDEFLIILSHAENPLEAAKRVATECLQALALPALIGDLEIVVGVSIGIVTCEAKNHGSTTASQLMSFADAAMYRAKANGRNCYIIHQPPSSPIPDHEI